MGDYITWEEIIAFQPITVSEKGQYAKGGSRSDPGQTILQLPLREKVGGKTSEEQMDSHLPRARSRDHALGVCGCREGRWEGMKRQQIESKESEQEYS